MRKRGTRVGKKSGKEPQKCVIYIFAEGMTERLYFKHFSNREHNVEIVECNTYGHTDSMGILNAAEKFFKENKKSIKLQYGDRGYCVFDSDPQSNTNNKLVFEKLKKDHGIGIWSIFSNPCFEVWLLLHFKGAPHNLSASQMKKELKKALSSDFPKYKETTDVFKYLFPRMEEARNRAIELEKSQRRTHDNLYDDSCNPFTDMHRFLEYLDGIREKSIHYNQA